MVEPQIVRIDKVLWYVWSDPTGRRHVEALCPKHNLRLTTLGEAGYSSTLTCAECDTSYKLPRTMMGQQAHVLNKVDAKIFKGMKVINLDDEYVPLAEKKLSSEDKKFFVTGVLTKSKVGLRLVIYAGKSGVKEKTQIFVEPAIKRLAFDHNDLHPSGVFIKVEATFSDNSKALIIK